MKANRDALAYQAREASEGPAYVRHARGVGGVAPIVATNEPHFDVYFLNEEGESIHVASFGRTEDDAVRAATAFAADVPGGPWTFRGVWPS